MIDFNFKIINPWLKSKFKPLYNRTGKLIKTKYWEVELYYHSVDIIGIRLNTEFRGKDHAGINIDFTLLGLTLSIKIYDNRHWNYSTNSWETYYGKWK